MKPIFSDSKVHVTIAHIYVYLLIVIIWGQRSKSCFLLSTLLFTNICVRLHPPVTNSDTVMFPFWYFHLFDKFSSLQWFLTALNRKFSSSENKCHSSVHWGLAGAATLQWHLTAFLVGAVGETSSQDKHGDYRVQSWLQTGSGDRNTINKLNIQKWSLSLKRGLGGDDKDECALFALWVSALPRTEQLPSHIAVVSLFVFKQCYLNLYNER